MHVVSPAFKPVSNMPKPFAVARLFDTPFIFIYSRQMASGLLTDEAEDEGKIAIGGEFGNAEAASPKGVLHAYEGLKMSSGTTACSAEK